MDAVYKTLRYGFPCYFLVIKTSIGVGRVVGTIIPQYETEELIAEGLKIIQQWSPQWNPKYFMTDKSPQELGAISMVHPKCIRFICDFHSLQAVERWVNKSSNGINLADKAEVKSSFRTLLYATSEEKFEEALAQILVSSWYKGNNQLQEYLRNQWLNCKPLWSHVYRQEYHANVNTDNFVESFNNVLKNHYLTLRHDKSVFSLTKILLHCIFPEQEREYAILTAKQSSQHRSSRSKTPDFLANRPFRVQSSCIANMEKAKEIPAASVSEICSKDGVYKVMSSRGKIEYDVKIVGGTCSCPYFLREKFLVNTFLVYLNTITGLGPTCHQH